MRDAGSAVERSPADLLRHSKRLSAGYCMSLTVPEMVTSIGRLIDQSRKGTMQAKCKISEGKLPTRPRDWNWLLRKCISQPSVSPHRSTSAGMSAESQKQLRSRLVWPTWPSLRRCCVAAPMLQPHPLRSRAGTCAGTRARHAGSEDIL